MIKGLKSVILIKFKPKITNFKLKLTFFAFFH